MELPPPRPPVVQPSWPQADAHHLLLSSAAMQGLEADLFASGLPVAALMEKAGLGLAQAVLQWPLLEQHGLLVLVGPGHNGGDGLVVARELHNRGIAVQIWSPFSEHKPLTASHLRHAEWLGIPRLQHPPDANAPALWLDALFGLGQRRPLQGEVAQVLLQRNQSNQPLWSIDGPSGLCSDSGQPTGASTARCSRTLVVGAWKQGLWQDCAMAWVGEQQRIELHLPAAALERWGAGAARALWSSDATAAGAPDAAADRAASKHGRGRLRVIAGSPAYPGAARLALEGASATGLGWLEAVVPQPMDAQLWQVLPHVVLQPDTAPLERLDAVLFGPGVGGGSLPSGLQAFNGLLLLDADGLNRLAATGEASQWLRQRQGPTWLTPHRAEFQRLFPHLAQAPPLQAVAEAAQHCRCSVLLKGAHSLIASADGAVHQLLQSDSWAARAGLGDVLAGYSAAMGSMALAAGHEPSSAGFHAVFAQAALRHASAGVVCAGRGRGSAAPLAVAQQLQQLS